MPEQTTVKLTKFKLEIEGVQVTFKVNVGDWTSYVSISPIDYEVFKKWPDIYADRVVESICENIEHTIKENYGNLNKENNNDN